MSKLFHNCLRIEISLKQMKIINKTQKKETILWLVCCLRRVAALSGLLLGKIADIAQFSRPSPSEEQAKGAPEKRPEFIDV